MRRRQPRAGQLALRTPIRQYLAFVKERMNRSAASSSRIDFEKYVGEAYEVIQALCTRQGIHGDKDESVPQMFAWRRAEGVQPRQTIHRTKTTTSV
jgi:hypothetical protein